MSLNENEKSVKAMMIIEILGKPAEHVVETLENMIKQIDEEKGVQVVNKKISDPKKIEPKEGEKKLPEGQEFYSAFAEIEVEVEEVFLLSALMFKYMPAHIDVISPENLTISNNDWNSIFNELVRKLHGYDEIARVIQIEKALLERKLREALGQ